MKHFTSSSALGSAKTEAGGVDPMPGSADKRPPSNGWSSKFRRLENVPVKTTEASGKGSSGGKLGKTTSHAWEKLSNVIRKSSSRSNEKEKEKKLALLEPRMQECESEMKKIGVELEEIKKSKPSASRGDQLISRSASSRSPSQITVNSEESNLDELKEELHATYAELKELSDRCNRLEAMCELERGKREKAERELNTLKKATDEGALPFIDSSESTETPQPLRPLNGCTDRGRENTELTSAREKELERLIREQADQYEMKMEEQRGMIRDMLMAVRVAQAFKEEAEAEAARFRIVHNGGVSSTAEEREEAVLWCELKRGRADNGSRRNTLLAWVKDTEDCGALAMRLCAEVGIACPPAIFSSTTSSAPDWRAVMQVVLNLYRKLFFKSGRRGSVEESSV